MTLVGGHHRLTLPIAAISHAHGPILTDATACLSPYPPARAARPGSQAASIHARPWLPHLPPLGRSTSAAAFRPSRPEDRDRRASAGGHVAAAVAVAATRTFAVPPAGMRRERPWRLRLRLPHTVCGECMGGGRGGWAGGGGWAGARRACGEHAPLLRAAGLGGCLQWVAPLATVTTVTSGSTVGGRAAPSTPAPCGRRAAPADLASGRKRRRPHRDALGCVAAGFAVWRRVRRGGSRASTQRERTCACSWRWLVLFCLLGG